MFSERNLFASKILYFRIEKYSFVITSFIGAIWIVINIEVDIEIQYRSRISSVPKKYEVSNWLKKLIGYIKNEILKTFIKFFLNNLYYMFERIIIKQQLNLINFY